MEILLFVILALLPLILILQIIMIKRSSQTDLTPLNIRFETLEKSQEKLERAVREEIALGREESTKSSREQRQELVEAFSSFGQTVVQRITESGATQAGQLELFSRQLSGFSQTSGEKLDAVRVESANSSRQLRTEVIAALNGITESTTRTMGELSNIQKSQLEGMSAAIGKLSEIYEKKLEELRITVEGKLQTIQNDNAKQLEQMRLTVDEKLQGTLEKRLGESFKLVSERLELVHKGLGEMQSLASGVGDLKKVLTNVKTRGTWGEVQLGVLLEQVLNPEQFTTNLATKDGGERVEFAIRLPGQGLDMNDAVWLPIDAKFPIEDYQRLLDAQERGDLDGVETAGRQLEARVKGCASDISSKYLNPPKTTDFGILFLPIEGLFAEVIRRTGLTEAIQRDCRVVIAGPTTLWSILSSLQMGFRTLAIQKRSSEVWKLLAAVKTEWTKYGDILDVVQKKLNQASDTIEKAKVRSRAVGRKLKDVQELPAGEISSLLPSSLIGEEDEEAERHPDSEL